MTTSTSNSHLPASVRSEDVLDQLTQRITGELSSDYWQFSHPMYQHSSDLRFPPTVRLRSELQAELQKSSVKTESNHRRARQQIEGSLFQEIESHTCPICYELMVAPQNAPILLFPCGMHSCASTSLGQFRVTAKLCSLSPATLLQHHTNVLPVLKSCHLERLFYVAMLCCCVICGNECRSYLLQRLYSVPHSAAQEEIVSLLPRSHTVTGGIVQLLSASVCIPFASTPVSTRAPAGAQAVQQRHNCCM